MKRNKGFTLVEAAVAIGVVAILSGIIVPLVINNIRDARIARARNDIQVIAGALAHQLKDMGSRPIAAPTAARPTPGGCNATGTAVWTSHGDFPWVAGGAAGAAAVVPGLRAENTFGNLFLAPSLQGNLTNQQANWLFGLGVWRDRDEFKYHGPYMGDDLGHMTDPWGRCYIILGYNAAGQENHGPIWIVSAGASRTIHQNNLTPAGGVYRSVWDYQGDSATNIAVRVQ